MKSIDNNSSATTNNSSLHHQSLTVGIETWSNLRREFSEDLLSMFAAANIPGE